MHRPDRPHVLLVHDAYADYVTCLANALAEEVPVTLLHNARIHSMIERSLSPAVKTAVYPYLRIRDPRRMTRLPRADRVAASVGAEIVHLQQSNDPLFNFLQLPRRSDLPRVMTVHDVSPHPGDGTRIPGGHVTLRARRRRIDRFIAHAEPLRDDLACRWQIPERRIDVVPHGELGRLYRGHASRAGRTGTVSGKSGGLRVLFFGRVWPYKGLDRLIEAMNMLAPTRPGLVLTIAGVGESLDRYVAAVRRPLEVELLNRYVRPDEVAEVFEASAVVCLPYLEASQSGVHALACGMGVPVVASAVGGLVTAVVDGRDGLLVPPDDVGALADALARVLDDPKLRARLSAGATARALGDLGWARVADATLGVYARAAWEHRR